MGNQITLGGFVTKIKQSLKRAVALALSFVSVATVCCACDFSTEASKVNHNLNQEAGYFNCERKLTVYNAIKHETILEIEGYMDISNNAENELVVTCKTGENEYKKNYVFLNTFVLYTVEDITGTHSDPYHYEMVYHTGIPIDIDMNPVK